MGAVIVFISSCQAPERSVHAMPKIIENLKENILAEARHVLTTEGYQALTVRRVAGALNIGVGTIYNYYPSKLELAAGVLEEDWNAAMQEFRCSLGGLEVEEILRVLFEIFQNYSAKYSSAWREYERHVESRALLTQYYTMILNELSGYISQGMPKEQLEAEPFLPGFLGELILRFGSDERSSYERIRPGLEKLLR